MKNEISKKEEKIFAIIRVMYGLKSSWTANNFWISNVQMLYVKSLNIILLGLKVGTGIQPQ